MSDHETAKPTLLAWWWSLPLGWHAAACVCGLVALGLLLELV
jgi:hypothetical protein